MVWRTSVCALVVSEVVVAGVAGCGGSAGSGAAEVSRRSLSQTPKEAALGFSEYFAFRTGPGAGHTGGVS